MRVTELPYFLILAMFLFMGLAVAWSGGWPNVKADSKTQRVLDKTHLTSIALATLTMACLPSLTDFNGAPLLAYASGLVLAVSLPLFPMKMHYPVNVLIPPKGTRAKATVEQTRSSRWPFSLAWTIGYILAGCYVATIFGLYAPA